MPGQRKLHLFLLLSLGLIFLWSAVKPKQYSIWILESLPAVAGVTFALLKYNRFRLTTLSYVLIWLAAIIMFIGGHYTYGEVPLFNWLKTYFQLSRNYYDRLGHFADGFITAILVRELLLRSSPLRPGKMLLLFIVSFNLGISAAYELVEWGVAIISGGAADAFLGIQGDIWDTQWDMFLSFLGSVISLLTLSRLHTKYLEREIQFFS